tara:strand:+ start:2421 stop:4235 length:1815 start_codon:yes stop_codon:yes gene_type:complete
MSQVKGTMLRKLAINLNHLRKSTMHFLLGGIAKIRFGRTIFEKDDLETKIISISSSKLVSVKMLEEIISRNIVIHEKLIIFEILSKCVNHFKIIKKEKHMNKLYTAGIRALELVDLPMSIDFGKLYVDSINDENALRSLILFYQKCGHIQKPYYLLSRISDSEWKKKQTKKLELELKLLKKGIKLEEASHQKKITASKNILYHINQSLPHHSSGYAIRTQSLLKNLKEKQWRVRGYSRIGYPNDRYDFIGANIVNSNSSIDGINYYFTPSRTKSIAKLDIQQYQKENVKLIIKQAKKFNPSIIHCASNYSCGLAGTAAAKLLGIPSIYEMRGLWHVTRTAKQPEYADSDHYRMIEKLEIQAANNADHVFTITNGVKDVLLKNGINEKKISLLPNAVDTKKFKPNKRNGKIEEKFNLKGKTTIGYIGSFTDYEGLDYLLRAAASLNKKYYGQFKVLLIGDGVVLDDLKELRNKLKLNDIVHFTGRINHEEVLDYYSVIDIAAYPRKGTKVCELISPLKPLEAMAMGKAVIASNVTALSDMVKNGKTGILHEKDNVEDLVEKIGLLMSEPLMQNKLGNSARIWVNENRTWNETSKVVSEVYNKLIN